MQESEGNIPCDFPPEKSLGSCSLDIEKMPRIAQPDQEQPSPSTSNSIQLPPITTPSRSVCPDSKPMEFESVKAKIMNTIDTRDKLKMELKEILHLLDESQTPASDIDAIDKLKKRKRELKKLLRGNERDIIVQYKEFIREIQQKSNQQDTILRILCLVEKTNETTSELVTFLGEFKARVDRLERKLEENERETKDRDTNVEELELRIGRLEEKCLKNESKCKRMYSRTEGSMGREETQKNRYDLFCFLLFVACALGNKCSNELNVERFERCFWICH